MTIKIAITASTGRNIADIGRVIAVDVSSILVEESVDSSLLVSSSSSSSLPADSEDTSLPDVLCSSTSVCEPALESESVLLALVAFWNPVSGISASDPLVLPFPVLLTYVALGCSSIHYDQLSIQCDREKLCRTLMQRSDWCRRILFDIRRLNNCFCHGPLNV